MNRTYSKLASLLGSVSVITIASIQTGRAQQAPAAPPATPLAMQDAVPEQVLVTGSLIRGAVSVGVPVSELKLEDFMQSGALTTADLFRTVPAANVSPGAIGTNGASDNIIRETRVNLRGLDAGGVRSLMMVDGVRTPPQGRVGGDLDPSIIPAIALERVDVLVDGASATYGSDAIAGVINLILRRGYDGAMSQVRYTAAQGLNEYMATQLWGRTWDGGDITLSYEWYDDSPSMGKGRSKYTLDFTPWGLDNRIPIGSSFPGTISTGAPSATIGTGCTNCFAIPKGTGSPFNPGISGLGPIAPFSGSTLNWATFNTAANTGTNGSNNLLNPYSVAWYSAAQQRNASTITVDQRLTPDITFYGEGYYSDRRSQFLNAATVLPTALNATTVAVPTWNPYYPVGAPSGLRVSYNFSAETPSFTSAYELSDRFLGGLSIDLPGDWKGKIFYSESYEADDYNATHSINRNAVSAALGWTILPTAPTGTTPSLGTWTKPLAIPYLNLFCDASAYQCNATATKNYIGAIDAAQLHQWTNEKGVTFDGPLFDLPGGQVKAAIGAVYDSYRVVTNSTDGSGAPSLLVPLSSDTEARTVWATFAQLNIPLVGEANKMPGVAKLDLEGSWRHDQYSDFGGTSNPKVAFTWLLSEDLGLALRGSWGTSFRAPNFKYYSPTLGFAILGYNLDPSFSSPTSISINCDSGVAPIGSAAEKLRQSGFACGAKPGGLSAVGGSTPMIQAGWRDLVNQDGQVLHPETATNWSFGTDFAPTAFFKGLDVQATWYSIKINNLLTSFRDATSTDFNDGSHGFSAIVPSDVGCPVSANLNPATCAPFEQLVANMLANTRSPVPLSAQTSIFWLGDGGEFNKGWQKIQGIDWNVSYDGDLGDLGTWNTGMTGTYYLHNYTVTVPGASGPAGQMLDAFHTTIGSVGGIAQAGVPTLPRMAYRARLGWANNDWNITGFMNYQSHWYNGETAPPNVNNQCTTAGGTTAGGSLPCLISNYTNIEPSYYTFDLSVGYELGDRPANDYLKNVSIQLVVQNLTDRRPSFEYRTSVGGGGSPGAYDVLRSDQGRTISIALTKRW